MTPSRDVHKSIAVLPFADMSRKKDQDYFCEGLAEELIDALTKIKELRVVARSTAFSLMDKHLDSREIGRELQVDTIVEGSVRKAGTRLRITAQLTDATDGSQIWSERYDRDEEDIFDIQEELALSIVEQLKIELLGEDKEALTRRPTESAEAYNYYLQGRFHWNQRTAADLEAAIGCFEQAIGEDPSYALAYTGLADAYNVLGFYSVLAPHEAFQQAQGTAQRALELDHTLAEAHASLAFTRLYYDWDWTEAEAEFQRAIALNPHYATAHHWYSELLALAGRLSEAATHARQAVEADPDSLIIHVLLGWTHYYSYEYDKAIEQYLKTLKRDPEFVAARIFLGLAYVQKRRYEKAITEYERTISIFGKNSLLTELIGHAHAGAGNEEAARDILNAMKELSKKQYVSAYYLAAICAELHEPSQMYEWLDRALEERDNWLAFLKLDPIWHGHRSDPRFKTLLAQVGLD
ncbi:MAG: tetratricopeptide repeat protein [Fidelibacterota bacterium]|nr:MAG: tetratricopeptide repeat protein [Candidatus Neomarinimicrobiota bacterium]